MATVFTHSLVGVALTPLVPTAVRRWPAMVVLVLLPVLPDLDVIAFSFGIPYEHPLGHRGFTHSLAFAALLGYAAALGFVRHCALFGRAWWQLGAIFTLAVASHGLLDALTDAGRGIAFFWPWDNSRYFFPTRPLATSPIGIAQFFNGQAWAILANEMRWVWLPTALVWVVLVLLRRLRKAA